MMSPTILLPLVLAAAGEPRDELRRLISSDSGYVQLREQLTSEARSQAKFGKALDELAARVNEVSWKEAVFAEAVRLHVTPSRWIDEVARPSGLVPSIYLKSRIRKPMPLEALSKVDESRAALLFELWFKAEQLGTYSVDDDFPVALPASERMRLRALERDALGPALLHVIARSRHAAAPYLIREVATKDQRASIREAALTALGETQHPLAFETLKSVSMGSDRGARAAAIVGLAAMSRPDALELLLGFAMRPASDGTLLAVLRGLSRFAARGELTNTHADAIVGVIRRTANEAGTDDALVELSTQLAKTRPEAWGKLTPATEAERTLVSRVATRVEWSKRRAR
ncbi:MAG: HEAT repeat domain-containing protein [Deltaproteobacteria bacterium]|nr:HEAT repeat domain-containing protein [Deltaproteobacteria bacterium]